MARTDSIDLTALKDLILWARKQRVAISQVSIGGVALALNDLALAEQAPKARSEPATTMPADAYERWGGAAIRDMMAKLPGAPQESEPEMSVTYEDDDD